MASFYSVNVTGVGGAGSSAATTTAATKQRLSSAAAATTGNSTSVRASNTVMVNSSKFPFGPD